MKPAVFVFKRPVKIFQVFRSINIYGKEHKSFDTRKEKLAWKPMQSTSGHVINQELFLPESILDLPNFQQSNLITLVDDHLPPVQSAVHRYEKNHCLQLPNPGKIDIFQIRMNEEVELHLNYGYYEVGSPTRKNFKLAEIRRNLPIEIKINGKIDAQMPRMFKEQTYIFDYIGDFSECFLCKSPAANKTVPNVEKTVDLTKRLW